jgi:putative hemolysin
MNANQIAAVVSIILLTLLNAIFTLAKTSLVTVRHAGLAHAISEAGDANGVSAVQRLLKQPSKVFATLQVCITLASFTSAALAAAVLSPDLAHYFHRWGIPHCNRSATVVLTLVAAFFTMTFGELIPYSYAQRHPGKAVVFVAMPIGWFVSVFSGLATIALGVSNLLVKPFGLTATFAAPLITEEELRTLLEASAESGAIEEEEKEIIRNVISFGDTDVRQVMTPRIDMTAAEAGIDINALVELIVESGHSRIPIYEGTVDSIVGIVHAKDLLLALARGEQDLTIRNVARAPLFVSENKRVDDLLEQFRIANMPIAIVQDEYGGTAGLVTIEDLLEELVGEIKDEYDTEEPLMRIVDRNTVFVDGRMSISDINEELDLDIPKNDFDTIGGFVFGLFGHQPHINESLTYDSVAFTVTQTDGRRIQEVRLDLTPDAVVLQEPPAVPEDAAADVAEHSATTPPA